MKITSQVKDTEGSSGHKEWKKLETIPAWQLDKMKSKKGGYPGSRKRQQESPLCIVDGHVSPQKCGVRTPIA